MRAPTYWTSFLCRGMEVEDANGFKTTVWPMIYAVVTDWQEGCVAAGTKSGNKTNCPCHTCLVLACDLDDLVAGRRAELRTEKRMKQIYDQVVELHKKGGCNAVIESLLKGWSANPVEVCGSSACHPLRSQEIRFWASNN